MNYKNSTTDLAYFREELKRLRDELEDISQTGESAARTVELDQARVGRLSRMDAMQAQAMSQESNRRRVAAVARIRAALSRLEAGEFGLCAQCQDEIDPRRLSHDPTVVLCIDCATRLES